MIKKESIITKTNGTFRMSAIKYTYGLYKNNTLNYWKGVFRQGCGITRRYWHHYRVRALYLQARGIRDRLCIVHCCQSIRGEQERAPNGSSCWGVRGNTSSRFTSPGNSCWHDPYAEPPPVLHHTYPMSIPSTVSVCEGEQKPKPVHRVGNLSLMFNQVWNRDRLHYVPAFWRAVQAVNCCWDFWHLLLHAQGVWKDSAGTQQIHSSHWNG